MHLIWGLLNTGFTVFRQEATPVLTGFNTGSLSWPNWNLGKNRTRATLAEDERSYHCAITGPQASNDLAVFHNGDFTYNMMRVSLQ